jgi:hypothetical protein
MSKIAGYTPRQGSLEVAALGQQSPTSLPSFETWAGLVGRVRIASILPHLLNASSDDYREVTVVAQRRLPERFSAFAWPAE